jgi:RNA polymerase sigma-70 factor (ECF subfamily)
MPRRPSQERFLALLDEHKKILYKVAGSYSRTLEDRQDLEQEIVAQLWRSFGRYDENYKFSTWMYRIALNVAISFYRGETRRSRSTVDVGESVLEIADPRGGTEPDAGLQILRRLIAELDELDRALILLYLDGHRHDTIAEILGISETNVGTKIGRIKARLRRDAATL